MTTPKLPGMTPQNFTYSPALLGHSPALLGHSPAVLKQPLQPAFSTPEAMASMGIGLTPGPGVPQIVTDESKKAELAEILRVLAVRPGRISEEGVERLAKRMGLECYKDTAIPGLTTMSLAAKIFLLDIDFRDTFITRVALSFANTSGPSQELARLADAILHRNLSPRPTEHPPLIPPSLSAFADNLQRLAKTDRLSSPPHLNCFMAITGLYTSLSKIYTHEAATLEGGVAAAMCKGTGRPRMHARGKVGLSIDYWQEHRHTHPPSLNPPDSDSDPEEGEEEKTYRVLIEVEELPPPDFNSISPITPVRTSTEWVSDEIKKPSDTSDLFGESTDGDVTDWLDPPLEELLEAPVPARFVAVLDPPLAVPFADEIQLFGALMLSAPAGINVVTLEALLFPSLAASGQLERIRQVFVGTEDEKILHRYKLHTGHKPVYSRFVTEVPFSHPKELVGVFQILRQFAFAGTLLRSAFDPLAPEAPPSQPEEEQNAYEDEDDLDAFLNETGTGGKEEGPLKVDVSMVSNQEGGFSVGVIYPGEDGQGLVSFEVEVGRNAEVRIVGGGGVDGGGVERAVVVSEDLGVVVEWVRRGGGSG